MLLKKQISVILFFVGLTSGSFGQFGNPNKVSNIEPSGNLVSFVTLDSDMDGDLDIMSLNFLLPGDYYLSFYEQIGPGKFESADTITSNGTGSIDTADINADGLIDIVLKRSNDSTLLWKQNLGSNIFDVEQVIANGVINPSELIFKDVNSDGFPEVFYALAGTPYKVEMCFNIGGTGFSPPILISTASQNFLSLDLNDLNGDANPDIVFSNPGGDLIEWVENDGTGNFLVHHVISSTNNFPVTSKIVDLDNDGDFDVLTSYYSTATIMGWFENDGFGNFTNIIVIDTFDLDISEATDIDFDGDADIVIIADYDSTVYWYENLGNGSFLTPKIVGNWQDDAFMTSSVDLNSDGYKEVIVGSSLDDNIAWYESLTTGFFGKQHLISQQAPGAQIASAADINGDGLLDVVVGSGFPGASWFENFGQGEFEFQTTVMFWGSTTWAQYTADKDNDGDIDILLCSSGVLSWQENDGNGSFHTSSIINDQASFVAGLGASDLDQDGDLDVFSSQAGWSGSNHVIVSMNLGSGIYGPLDTLATYNGESFSIFAEDIDSDGDDDLFYSDENAGISVFENLGSGNFGPEQLIIGGNPRRFDIADIDNDGEKDLVIVSSLTSSVEWHKNLGGFSFGSQQIVDNAVLDPWGIKCTDFDNDGDLDIVVASDDDSTMAWFENINNGIFGPKNIIHNGVRFHNVETADLDNDFDQDIIGVGWQAGSVLWYENFNYHPIKISGRVFADIDQNGINDSSDLGMNQLIVGSNPSSDYSYTYSNGDYSMIFSDSTGVYLISPNVPQYWNLTTDSVSYTILVDSNGTAMDSLDFGFYPDSLIYDMNLDIVGGQPTCDDTINYWAYWENIGTTLPSGIIKITLDDSLQFINSIIPPDSISGNVVYWSFDSLSYFSFISLDFEVGTPNFMNAGDTVISYFELVILDSLYNPVDTLIDSLVQIITCAYDPNDKISDPIGVGLSGFVDPSLATVEYTIRFQNTGTDTAQHVLIKDALDPNLDWSTLTFLSASHQVQTIVDNSGNLNFNFYNIFLPDSNVDKQGSQGYVKYKIDLLPAVPVGTSILNSAEIYFDQNPPVITNTKILTLFDCQQVLAGMIFPSSSCENETVVGTIHDDSDSQYSWEFIGIDTLHGQSIQWLASQPGPINMKLSVNNQFCLHDTTVQIQIFPEIPLTQDPDAFMCPLDSVLVYNKYEYGGGVYYDTLQSVNGCDSIMMKEVFEYSSYLVDLGNLQVCSNDSILIFNEYQYLIGTYYDTLQTIDGCDSILFHDLSVNFYDSENDGSVSICLGDSAFIYGEYKLIQGVYYDSLVNIEGCDSIHYQELFVNPLPSVNFNTLSSDTLCTYSAPINLSATPSGGSFSGNGVSASQFDPNAAGNGDHYIYYFYTDGNNCSSADSALIHVGDCLGIHETEFSNVTIYPNPFKESTTISFGQELNGDYQLTIVDALGKQVYLKDYVTGNALQISRGELAKGSYFLSLTQISSGEKVFSSKLLIE